MVQLHPDIRFLTDYAAGSLPPSQAICVAAHLHYCGHCRAAVEGMVNVGSTLFTALEPVAPTEGLFDQIMSRVDAVKPASTDTEQPAEAVPARKSYLPKVISNFVSEGLDQLNWHNIGKSFRYSYLDMKDSLRETSLFFINAGGKIPRHTHGGDEITVVLKGSFSDQDGCYRVGDFILRTRGEKHKPVAAQDEDCLCISTLDAPIRMTNWFYKLLVPLFKFKAETA